MTKYTKYLPFDASVVPRNLNIAKKVVEFSILKLDILN